MLEVGLGETNRSSHSEKSLQVEVKTLSQKSAWRVIDEDDPPWNIQELYHFVLFSFETLLMENGEQW